MSNGLFSFSPQTSAARPVFWRSLSLGALGLGLCWLVVHHSLAAYFATTAPSVALLLNPGQANAIRTLADREINPVPNSTSASAPPQVTPKRLRALREQVESALLIDPLPARAYRLLGQIAEREGAAKRASAFMAAAARRSLHEGFASYWLMQKSFANKNYAAAAYYADALLRSGAAPAQLVFPVMARMAEAKGAANKEIVKLLAGNPPWRAGFFSGILAYLTDARTPLDLFLSLKDTPAPPTTQELNAYEHFLFQKKFYSLAYYVWLQFLPPDGLDSAGLLFNSDFGIPPSGSPFDWQAPAGGNVTVDFLPKDEKPTDLALFIEFGPGSVDFPGVSQAIMLSPGHYTLKGLFRGDLTGPRGVQWSAVCAEGPTLGQSQMFLGAFPDWRSFQFSFVVPESGCSSQTLRLDLAARSPSEHLVSGAIWFDAFQLARDQ